MQLLRTKTLEARGAVDLHRAAVGFASGLATSFLAVLLGLVASTANPLLIALILGLMGGTALLAVPTVSVWLIMILGLISGFAISMLGPGAGKLAWAISLLGFLLLLPSLLKLLSGHAKGTPAFIWLALAFLVYSVLATAVQWHSNAEFLAGFKRYFQMYGLMFALAVLAFKPEDYRRWLKLLLVVALLQLPFALYEFFVLVPKRGGFAAGAEATDVVAGSLGANLEGGSANAEMATFLLIAAAFLFARWRAGLMGRFRFAVAALLCLLPLGLGETKIVVIMLPVIGLVLMREELVRAPARYLPQIIAVVLLTAVLGYVYISMNEKTGGEVLQETLRYNFADQGYGQSYLNRTTVLTFWWDHQSWRDPLGFVIGHGLGSSYLSQNNPVPGHLALHYPRYGIDLTTASTILWDLGMFGLLLFLSILAAAWHAAVRLWKRAQDPRTHADAMAIQAAIALFALHVVYHKSMLNYLPFELIVAAVLGYLAYLVRTHPVPGPNQPVCRNRF
jgi:hypothetical protein